MYLNWLIDSVEHPEPFNVKADKKFVLEENRLGDWKLIEEVKAVKLPWEPKKKEPETKRGDE